MTISEQVLHPGGVEQAPVVPAPAPQPTLAPPVAPVLPAPAPVVAEPTPPVIWHVEATSADTTTGAVMAVASTTWNWTKCAGRVLNGLRTLLFFGVTGALAFGSKFADVDLSGTISHLVGSRVQPEDIIAFMSVSGIVLRFLTTTKVFDRWRKAAQGAIQLNASAGVDDPEDTPPQ